MESRGHAARETAAGDHDRLCHAGRVLLEEAVARIAALSLASRVSIALVDVEGHAPVAVSAGLDDNYLAAMAALTGPELPWARSIRDGIPTVSRDAADAPSPLLRAAAAAAGVRAIWSVPLDAGGRCAGAVTWHLDTPSEPSGRELELCSGLGRLVGLLLEQHRLDQRCRGYDHQLALQDLTASLLGAGSPVDVATALLAWARCNLGACRGMVLWHRDGEQVEVLAADGTTVEVDETSERAVWVEALQAARAGGCGHLPRRAAEGGRTRVLLPLAAGTGMAALLDLTFPLGSELDADLLDVLGTACATSGQALERARLHEAERRAAWRIAVMAEASRVLSEASLDLDIVLHAFGRLLINSLADGCIIRLLSDDGEWLETSSVHHRRPEIEDVLRRLLLDRRSRLRTPLGDAAVSSGVLLAGAGAIFGEWSAALQPGELDELMRLPCENVAILPLRIEQRSLGSLAVLRTPPSPPFSADDVAVLRELASRAALAIDNARLHRDSIRAVRIRDDFVSVAGHELKTPLTALHLQAHMLTRTAADASPRIRQHGERILTQTARLARLVDELLDVSRIASGRLQVAVEPMDLRSVVLDVTRRHAADLERAGCSMIVEAVPVHGRWDRLRIEQVLSNLLSNAAKYGAGKPVQVSLEGDRATATLRVADRGIGIAPEDQARVFERFERAVSARRFGGLGLGLWIARQIVEAHGGAISVVSRQGEGSTFTVELPVRP